MMNNKIKSPISIESSIYFFLKKQLYAIFMVAYPFDEKFLLFKLFRH